jgi:sulfotransferase
MDKQYVFLAGLPRSGSTLFASIINQNPDVFASSTSFLCDALYHTYQIWNSRQALHGGSNDVGVENVIESIIPSFYIHQTESVIIDKSFTWGSPYNLTVLIKALGYVPKFIVMERDIPEIIASFKRLTDVSPNYNQNIQTLIIDPCIISYKNLLSQIPDRCFVVSYERLCNDTVKLLEEFYAFIDKPNFEHNLLHIKNTSTDNDDIWGLVGMHDIMPTIRMHKNG